MSTKLNEYYSAVLDSAQKCSSEALAANGATIAGLHERIADFSKLVALISSRPEWHVFNAVLFDSAIALFYAVTCSYRQSFTSQRMMLENAMAATYYSAHPIKLRRWLDGRDVSWTKITSGEEGVFTSEFFDSFAPELLDKLDETSSAASELYSNLSDYVHKNVKTIALEAIHFAYDHAQFTATTTSLTKVLDVVIFMFCLRYLGECRAEVITSNSDTIETLVGHYPYFQKLIGGQVGG